MNNNFKLIVLRIIFLVIVPMQEKHQMSFVGQKDIKKDLVEDCYVAS